MSKPNSITLPAQHIRDTHNRWSNTFSYPSGLSGAQVWVQGRQFHYVHTVQPGFINFELVENVSQDKQRVEKDYAERNRTLKSDLDAQVQQLAGPLNNLIQQQVLERQSSATQQLLAEKSAALPAQQQAALQFFGQSPLDKSINDFLNAALRRTTTDNHHQTWLSSFKAAYEAKLLASTIDHLSTKAKALEVAKKFAANEIKRAQRLEQKIRVVDLLLANLDLARHNHQVSSRQLQENLETFARHELETPEDVEAPLHDKALESELAELLQTHKAHNLALNEIQRYAIRLQVQHQVLKSALQFAPPRNTQPASIATANDLLHKSAEVLAGQEQQHKENLRLSSEYSKRITAAITSTNNELARIASLGGSEIPQRPYTYRLPQDSTSRVQVITPAAASMSSFAVVGPALGVALQAARPFLIGPPRLAAEIASLLLFSFRLDHGDRYGVSSPLKELLPDVNLQDVFDSIGKQFEVPIRLFSGMLGENSHIQAVGTNAEDVLADVPVRQANWDAAQGAYSFVTEGPGPITVLWTQQGTPADSSTTLPAEDPPPRLYPGIISVPSTPNLLTFPSTSDLHFSDYIITFPADSGLEPVYIMFKNPRDYAGVAAGSGQTVTGWRGAMNGAQGAPIPTQIADRLRGGTFSRWSKLKEAIWMAIANDPELSKQFSESDLDSMRRGKAAFTQESGRVGSRQTFNIHHIHPIAQGGAVYDLDNLVIMTPKAHIDIHRKEID